MHQVGFIDRTNKSHTHFALKPLQRGIMLALLGVAIAAPINLVTITPAQAETQQQLQSFTIPAGSMESALAAFSAQSGVNVSFTPEVVKGKNASGLNGQYQIDEALSRILAGSGLQARIQTNGSYNIGLSDTTQAVESLTLPTVQVSAPLYGAKETNSLKDSSSSVGIVSSEDISKGQIRYTRDAFRRLANVQDSATLNSGFVIRGMSSEGFVPAGAPAGTLYVDGILQTRYNARFGSRSLWDVEQVEVYRGPQSTLSGRSAMVGAIYIKSKDPTFNKEFELSGTAANNDLYGAAFVANMPVFEDQVAVRVSGTTERSKTDISYPTFRDYEGYDDLTTPISQSLRTKFLFTPSAMPNTQALLTYSYSNDRPNERLIGERSDLGFDLSDQRGDFYDPVTYAEFRAIEVHNLGLEITHDLSDTLLFTSQTGLQYGETTRRSVDADTAGIPNGIWGTVDDTLITQEFRLNYEGESWKWVTGIFGSHQKFDSAFDAVAYEFYQWDQTQDRKTDNLAIFGEATYEFVPSWFVTAGGRVDYLRERTTEDNAEGLWPGNPTPIRNQADFDEVNFVPKLGISKKFGELHTVSLTYSQGFRTGGFYVDYESLTSKYYDPEFAQSYELSYKGYFLQERLMLNANFFVTKYEDQQIEVRPDPSRPSYRVTTNAASSRSWGFEIEPTFQVTEQFSAFASLGYLNTEFLEFSHAEYGDLSGERFPEAPKWTLGFGGRYEFLSGLYAGADAKYTADYNSRFGAEGMHNIDSRFILNAQIGYIKNNWEITIFAENLTDERYLTVVDPDAVPVYAQLGEERTIGVNLKVRF